ncbi:24603_t:CDS:2 [Cetraspora pellucida]|uniref:24603_t:CDS:1 n=1 Tax=Cetraspora pellucida TaxID=1433469 RepID=A0A9N9E9I1_9GLOM|nr:24603_t:CDS:2 [Cetraspora pellucida]
MAIKKQISNLFKKCGLKNFKLKAFCSSCKLSKSQSSKSQPNKNQSSKSQPNKSQSSKCQPSKGQNCENQSSIDQKLEINAQENNRNSKRRSDEKPEPFFDTSLNNDSQHRNLLNQQNINHNSEKVSLEKYVEKETLEEEDMLGSVPIKLTVGEMQFTTRQQTLCVYPSYLSELFFIFRSPNTHSNSSHKNVHPQLPWPDKLFIDRDGSLFVYVLEFLRTSTLPKLPLSTLQKLEREAKFYAIKPLQALISKRLDLYFSFPEFKVIPVQNISSHEFPQFSRSSDLHDSIFNNYDAEYCPRDTSYDGSEETITDLYAPDYDLITVTTIPIFFKKCPFGHGEENRVNDFYCDTLCNEDHVVLVKEIVTCMIFKRKDT